MADRATGKKCPECRGEVMERITETRDWGPHTVGPSNPNKPKHITRTYVWYCATCKKRFFAMPS